MAIYQLDTLTPEIHEDSWVAETAAVIGKVRLQAGVGIWFGATLRGDNEFIDIGENSNVQESSVLHTDIGHPLTVGKSVTIGHQAMLHGCSIGDNCLIGMQAIILNGARVGENCLIGAGSLIPEGKEIPAGSLVMGTPAKVVRPLTAEEITRLARGPKHYAERQRQYRAQLKRIDA